MVLAASKRIWIIIIAGVVVGAGLTYGSVRWLQYRNLYRPCTSIKKNAFHDNIIGCGYSFSSDKTNWVVGRLIKIETIDQNAYIHLFTNAKKLSKIYVGKMDYQYNTMGLKLTNKGYLQASDEDVVDRKVMKPIEIVNFLKTMIGKEMIVGTREDNGQVSQINVSINQ